MGKSEEIEGLPGSQAIGMRRKRDARNLGDPFILPKGKKAAVRGSKGQLKRL